MSNKIFIVLTSIGMTVLLFTAFEMINSEKAFAGLGYEGLSEEQAELFQKVGNNLRCPTCTGLSVLQSEAGFATKIRDAAREQVVSGKSEAEIMLYFTERYGLWILRKPPAAGFHLLAWGVPIGFAIIGPILMWFFVWRRRKEVSLSGVRPTHEIITEMEKELNLLRG